MWIGPVEATVSPRGSRTSDPAVGSFARADAESADGNCKRLQLRAYDFFFILTQFVRVPFRPKGIKNELIVLF